MFAAQLILAELHWPLLQFQTFWSNPIHTVSWIYRWFDKAHHILSDISIISIFLGNVYTYTSFAIHRLYCLEEKLVDSIWSIGLSVLHKRSVYWITASRLPCSKSFWKYSQCYPAKIYSGRKWFVNPILMDVYIYIYIYIHIYTIRLNVCMYVYVCVPCTIIGI